MRHTYDAVIGERAKEILSRDARLTVVAVHSESVYARCADGRLFLLCPDKYGRVPFGVSLPEYALFRERHTFEVGDVITAADGALVTCGGEELFFTEKSTAPRTDRTGKLPDTALVGICADYVRENASARGMGPALPAFLCIGTPADTANAYALSAVGEADRFESAFLCGDAEALDHAVGRFVGLGYGLTPSGDDFLCGMLYAFHRYSRVSDRSRNYLRSLSDRVEDHIRATNEVSAEYIRCALDGEYFEVVERVLDCLSNEENNIRTLEAALSGLLSVGASSGSDILCGILFAVYLLW